MGWKAQAAINGTNVSLFWSGDFMTNVFTPNLEAATGLAALVNREADSAGDDDAPGAIAVVSKMVDNAERARVDHVTDLRRMLAGAAVVQGDKR